MGESSTLPLNWYLKEVGKSVVAERIRLASFPGLPKEKKKASTHFSIYKFAALQEE